MMKITPKEAFGKFKPESCVFVISIDENDKPSGMIAGWVMKCSNDPPLFAVALSKKGHTHKLIRESKEFVVAVPDKRLEKDLLFFGTNHGYDVDKFSETGIETLEAVEVKSPLLKKATINLECKLVNEVETGDHIMFIGEVVMAHHDPEGKVLFNMKKVDGKRVFEEF